MNEPNQTPPNPPQQAREQLQSLVREIEALADSNLPADLFFREYLERVALAFGADACALWLLDGDQGIRVQQFVQRMPLGHFENQELCARFGDALRETLSAGGIRIYRAGDPALAGLLLPHVQVFGPLQQGVAPFGVLHVLQRSDVVEGTGYLPFFERLCSFVPRYLQNCEQQVSIAATARQWREFEPVALALHGTLDVAELAAVAANDGAGFLGCDRVILVDRHGARLVVRAVSGQEGVNARSNYVRTLLRLAKVVLTSEERLTYAGKPEGLPPQLEEPLAEYLDASRSRMLTVVPLVPRAASSGGESSGADGPRGVRLAAPKPLGALVVEQVTESSLRPDFESRLEMFSLHLSQALVNARQVERLPLLGLWQAASRVTGALRGRRLVQAMALLLAFAAIATLLALLQWDYRVEGTGRMMPVARQGIFAPWDGQVVEVHVESGQRVEPGQVLLRLQNEELHARRLTVESEFDEKRKQLLAYQAELSEGSRNLSREEVVRLQGKVAQTQIEAEGAQKRLAVVAELEKMLEVRVPISGVVATFQLSQLLAHRPVRRGELLLEVMDASGPWRLEMEVPEQRMGHLLLAQEQSGVAELPVEFVLATAPEVTGSAHVESTATRSVGSEEQGNVVEVFAALDADELPHRRIGAEVTAKINCGRRSLGYVLFGDVIEFVRRRWWW